MGLLKKVLQAQYDMKGFSGENIPVKRTNGEFLPLAVSTVGQCCRVQSLSLPSYGTVWQSVLIKVLKTGLEDI